MSKMELNACLDGKGVDFQSSVSTHRHVYHFPYPKLCPPCETIDHCFDISRFWLSLEAGLRNLFSRHSRIHKPGMGGSSASQAKGSPSPGSLGLLFRRSQVRCAYHQHLPSTSRLDLTLLLAHGTHQQTLHHQIDDRLLYTAVAFAGYEFQPIHHGRSIHSAQVACGPLYRRF